MARRRQRHVFRLLLLRVLLVGPRLGRAPNTLNLVTHAVARQQKTKRAATMGDPRSLILLAPVLANVSNHVPGSRG
jgi:hypothetical protein